MDKVNIGLMYLQGLKVKTFVPIIGGLTLCIVTFILLLNGYGVFYLINVLSLVFTGILILRFVRYYRSIVSYERIIQRAKNVDGLYAMAKNINAPSTEPSHYGMNDNYYDQTKRFSGIIGDTDQIVLNKLIKHIDQITQGN